MLADGAPQLNALIVDPAMESRSRLKGALRHEKQSSYYNKISSVSTIGQALSLLKESPEYDLILVSNSFAEEELARFVTEAAATREDRYAFIVVLKPEMQNAAVVLGRMMVGMHGFLCEPFSLDSLMEITEAARKVQEENEERRLLASLPILVDMMLKQIRRRSRSGLRGRNARPFNARYKKLVEEITSRYPDKAPSLYYEALLGAVGMAQPRAPKAYDGASEVLRKKYSDSKENDPSSVSGRMGKIFQGPRRSR
jgi:response regulator RpfG family c-di-GMP phosphodiesterase